MTEIEVLMDVEGRPARVHGMRPGDRLILTYGETQRWLSECAGAARRIEGFRRNGGLWESISLREET